MDNNVQIDRAQQSKFIRKKLEAKKLCVKSVFDFLQGHRGSLVRGALLVGTSWEPVQTTRFDSDRVSQLYLRWKANQKRSSQLCVLFWA